MDQTITQWINAPAGHSALLDVGMVAITRFGVPALILLVILQWWSMSERPHVRHACMTAGLSFLIGLGLNQIILVFVHRIRPYDAGVSNLIIDRSSDWSFPSDHATAAFAIAAAFLLCGVRRRGIALLIAALLIGVSRVYVGTHYASDILGGATSGIVAAAVVHALYREGTRADRFVTGIL
jgi:undecaprenyl-diphosphatase